MSHYRVKVVLFVAETSGHLNPIHLSVSTNPPHPSGAFIIQMVAMSAFILLAFIISSLSSNIT